MDRPTFHGQVVSVRSTRKHWLSVDVLENSENGPTFMVRLAIESRDDNDWISPPDVVFTDLCPDDARSVAALLWNAADATQGGKSQVGAMGVRRLPTIRLCGTEFFIDEQHRELRSVENPEHRFLLDESSNH